MLTGGDSWITQFVRHGSTFLAIVTSSCILYYKNNPAHDWAACGVSIYSHDFYGVFYGSIPET